MRISRSFGPLIFLISVVFLLLVASVLEAQSSRVINIVAAENFYGNIAQQIGGDKVTVTSVMSDPNVDPHEYESNVEDAKAIAAADLVIENGGGYDDWMDKLLSASPSALRIVLKGFDLAVKHLPDNEHVWYNVDNAQAIAFTISRSLGEDASSRCNLFLEEQPCFSRIAWTNPGEDGADLRSFLGYSRRSYRDDLSLPGPSHGAEGSYPFRVSKGDCRGK